MDRKNLQLALASFLLFAVSLMFISGGAHADEDEWFAWTSHSTSDRDDDGEKDSITFYFAPRTDEVSKRLRLFSRFMTVVHCIILSQSIMM